MEFEWDENKNEENIRKHGIDFSDAMSAFFGSLLAGLDKSEHYGEDRWIGIGTILGMAVVIVVVFVEREPDVIRIISARKATKRERENYEKHLRNELGEN